MTYLIKQPILWYLKARLIPRLLLFAAVLGLIDVHANTTDWIGGIGDWVTATNWTNGVPNLSSTVTIMNGGTATITGLTAPAANLTIGVTGGSYNNQLILSGGAGLEVSSSLTINQGLLAGGIVTIDPGGTVLNSGGIEGNPSAVALDFSGGGTLNNTNTGLISAAATSSTAFTFGDGAVRVDGAGGNINNAGQIQGSNGISLLNNGTITNTAGGVITGLALNENAFNSASGAGIFLAGGGTITNQAGATIQGTGQYSWGIHTVSPVAVNVDNFGTISGNVDGINVNSDSQIINEQGGSITSSMESAIAVSYGSNSVIKNSGTISSTATDGSPAIALFYGGTIINNASGEITGIDGNAVGIGFQGNSGPATVYNYGKINGNVTLADQPNAVYLYTGDNGTINAGGTINGNLNLGASSATQLVLDGSGQQALSQAVSGSITNFGSLIKQGAGSWIIDENLSAPVSTSVNSGILKVNQTLTTHTLTVNVGGTLGGPGLITGNVINNGGTVAPGDPQTLRFGGDYTQEAGGNLQIDIAGTGPSGYDILLVTGKVTLLAGSVLTLDFLNGFVPVAGDTFDFLQAGGGLTGSFSQIFVEGLTNGLQYLLQSDGSNGYELVTTTPSVPDGGQTLPMLLIGVCALIGAKCILQPSRQRRAQPSC